MTDIQLFRGLARQLPLEPITDAECYYQACNTQEELLENTEPAVQLYLKALAIFLDAYETGYRAD